jgi:putative tryptophan/tyrosine transport system substrate-binding protein
MCYDWLAPQEPSSGGRTHRRNFIKVIAGSAVAWPFTARAQAQQMRRIGVIVGLPASDAQAQLNVRALQNGLRERGLNEGKNIQIDFRFGVDTAESARLAATEILKKGPELIVAQGTYILNILKQMTRTVPIVFTVVSDPVGSGFVQSFAHPGGNITGFTNFLEPSIATKWVELLKEIAPKVSRVGILFNPKQAVGAGMYFAKPVERLAASLGVKVIELPVQTPADLEQAIEAFAREPGAGLITPRDATILPHRDVILALTARHLHTRCLSVPLFRYQRWLDVVWHGLRGCVSARSPPCRPHPERRKARRSTRAATNEIGTRSQPHDGQSAWP